MSDTIRITEAGRAAIRRAIIAKPEWKNYRQTRNLSFASMSKSDFMTACDDLGINVRAILATVQDSDSNGSPSKRDDGDNSHIISNMTESEVTAGLAYMDDTGQSESRDHAFVRSVLERARNYARDKGHSTVTFTKRQATHVRRAIDTAKEHATGPREHKRKPQEAKWNSVPVQRTALEPKPFPHVQVESASLPVPAPVPAPVPSHASHKPTDKAQEAREAFEGADDPVQAMAAAMRALLAQNKPAAPAKVDIDASLLVSIVREEIAAQMPRVTIEVKSADKTKTLPADKPRHRQFADLLQWLAIGENVYLCGPAGSGKTTACEQAAEALELPFYIQGAASGAHEFLGFNDANGRYVTTAFRQAFEHGGVFLADEIDASDPSVPLVINSATANGFQVFPDNPVPVKKHENFRFVAAANTFGQGADRTYVGRSQLDGATLDRFAFIAWTYDEQLETMLSGNAQWAKRVQEIRAAVMSHKLRHIISPRATIKGAKALAAGISMRKVEESLIWARMDDDAQKKVKATLAVSEMKAAA